ncbi:hypothetical protein BTO06_12900 [Tenacibaculum sp. SZ-18]|nr:hypothetical protein BTO06_12900 [Tenacibaculum sp. SZ-18]
MFYNREFKYSFLFVQLIYGKLSFLHLKLYKVLTRLYNILMSVFTNLKDKEVSISFGNLIGIYIEKIYHII